MWGWTGNVDGYCGETSFQSSLIYYGNYASQEQVRYADGNAELIISQNDQTAANKLWLVNEEWNYNQKQPQEVAFKAWLKKNIDAGWPVTAGWYLRELNGDPDYDHIMIVVGYTLDSKGAVRYLDQLLLLLLLLLCWLLYCCRSFIFAHLKFQQHHFPPLGVHQNGECLVWWGLRSTVCITMITTSIRLC
jgi:hypothetical protein